MRQQALVSLRFFCSILEVRPLAAEPETRDVIPAKTAGEVVSPETMRAIYEQVKTPFKNGSVSPSLGRCIPFSAPASIG